MLFGVGLECPILMYIDTLPILECVWLDASL